MGFAFSSPAMAAGVTSATYFGGAADDDLTGVAIGSDGSIFVSGTSTSAELAKIPGTTLQAGGGFVAKLDRDATKVLWLTRIAPAGALKLTNADEPIVITGHRLLKLQSDGAAVAWSGPDVGTDIASFDLSQKGDLALVAGNDVFRFGSDGTTQKFRAKTDRSHAVAVAIDPLSDDTFVSGDQNAGYGTCGGPWRSPFIFRYNAAGQRIAKLYDYPGQAACDQLLAADSFFTQLRFEENGELWVTGGSDGGNTVLGRAAADLSKENPALSGACFASACYGWKGAAAPRFVAHVDSTFSDFVRATFIVGHFNKQPTGCSCDVPQDDGSGARPNSAGLDYVFRTSTGDVVGAGSSGWHFPVVNAWYPGAAYTPGYPAVVSVLDGELKTMKMATMLPGTGSTKAAAYRGGRLVVVGGAPDNSAWKPPAGQEMQAQATVVSLPEGSALQPAFAGGKADGFVYVACVTTDEECGSAPAAQPNGGGGGVGGGGGNGGMTGGQATFPGGGAPAGGSESAGTGAGPAAAGGQPNAASAGSTAGATAAAATSGGCACRLGAEPSSPGAFALAVAGFGLMRIRRKQRRGSRTETCVNSDVWMTGGKRPSAAR